MNRKNLLWELWLLPGLMIGFGACQNDEIVTSAVTDSEGVGTNVITLTAEIGSDVESRAIIDIANEDEDYEYVLWSEGDVLIVQNLGQDGTDTDGAIYKFEISSDYSDDSPSSSATFICAEADTDAVTEGDVLCAFYLGNDATVDDYTNYLSLEHNVEFTSYTEDEIKEYLKDYMYMVGKATFSESGTSLSMKQLTSMLRVTYSNETDSDQTISYIKFYGDSMIIGTCIYYFIDTYSIWEYAGYGQINFTEGLTVGANESVDIYFLCFPSAVEFESSEFVYIEIDGECVSLRASDISTTTFEIGYRYWFDVTKYDTGLEWTNYEPIYDDYTTIYSGTNDALCEVLVDLVSYSYIDDDGNLQMPTEIVESTTSLDLNDCGLTSLEGIECFTNLEYLYCAYNDLTSFDSPSLVNLKWLFIHGNSLTSLDISALKNLVTLYCYSNNLTELDLSNNTALGYFFCEDNELTSLDLSNNTALLNFDCQRNALTSLDLSNNTNIKWLYCNDNELTSLDLSNNTALIVLDCRNNLLTELDITENTSLENLYCGNQTDYDGNDQTLTLTLDASQNELWESTWQYDSQNCNVTLYVEE